MKIYPDTQIIIPTPANIHTGGVELLHQLCSQLLQFGLDAKILYYARTENESVNREDPVDDAYKKYHLPNVEHFLDTKHNVWIVNEGATQFLYNIQKCQRVLWWMSVYSYVHGVREFYNVHLQNTMSAPLAKPIPKIFTFGKDDSDVEHWVQSEYARQFIKLNGIEDKKIFFVGDYLNQAFLSKVTTTDFSTKENWVAYNPKKGLTTTLLLMKLLPDVTFKPIQNMTATEVQELLAKCKIYIDFGNHPGRDRIPREAALSGCVVLTGKLGSAANDIDINIPSEFKFDDQPLNIDLINKKFQEVFENFETEFAKQADYRKIILQERKKFAQDVAKAFRLSHSAKKFAGIFNLNDKSVNFAKSLLQKRSELIPRFIIDDNKIESENVVVFQSRRYVQLDDRNQLEIISQEDAKFLCLEGRITHLVTSPQQVQEIKDSFAISEENILLME